VTGFLPFLFFLFFAFSFYGHVCGPFSFLKNNYPLSRVPFAVLLYSSQTVFSLSFLSSLRFRRLVLLVVVHDVGASFVLHFHIPLLVLTTLHADHDSFHLVSSVRHTQPAHCTYYLGHHSRKCTRRRCMITVLPSSLVGQLSSPTNIYQSL